MDLATTQEARHTTSRKTPVFWTRLLPRNTSCRSCFQDRRSRWRSTENTRASLCKRRCLPGRFGTHYQSDDALETRPEGAWLPVASQLYTLSQYFSSLDRMKQWPILCIGHSPERFLFAQPANDTYFMQLESNHRTTTYSLLPHWQPA